MSNAKTTFVVPTSSGGIELVSVSPWRAFLFRWKQRLLRPWYWMTWRLPNMLAHCYVCSSRGGRLGCRCGTKEKYHLCGPCYDALMWHHRTRLPLTVYPVVPADDIWIENLRRELRNEMLLPEPRLPEVGPQHLMRPTVDRLLAEGRPAFGKGVVYG